MHLIHSMAFTTVPLTIAVKQGILDAGIILDQNLFIVSDLHTVEEQKMIELSIKGGVVQILRNPKKVKTFLKAFMRGEVESS